jgi:16S rRNA (cytosine1402-N4)-methyltransferase
MAIDPTPTHIPVLCKEMVEILDPLPGKVYVDGTFGGGGYTRAILNKGATKVIAFDRDDDAVKRAESFNQEFGERFEMIHSCFSEMDKYLKPESMDGIVFDFGISSYQVDEAHRGFSFRQNGPLDMRMGLGATYTASEVVNTFKEKDIAEILYVYGEEPRSRQIARAIIEARSIKPFETTQELALLIRKIVSSQEGFDPATLTFQGLRIFINNELIEIERALKLSNQLLPIGGRLVTVAFHALEDRLVKNHSRVAFSHQEKLCMYTAINRKTITPSLPEIRSNPRCRSAKLRGFIKEVRR